MGLWLVSAVLFAGLVLLAEAPALAQPLNEVLNRALSNSCSGLNGPGVAPPGPPAGINPNYGPQLVSLCGDINANAGTAQASTAAGTISDETRISSIGPEQRIRRRTQERRDAAREDSVQGRGLGLFFTADYERFDKDTTRFETGFDRDTFGGTVGADYVVNPFVLVGLGFNYAHEFGKYDVGGGFDHDSYGVLLYTSLSPIPRGFVDLVAGYVRKDYRFQRRVLLDIPQLGNAPIHVDGKTRADTDADELRLSANGGYDFTLRNITVGPRLGVNYRDTRIDGFKESGGKGDEVTGVELRYENQNIVSLTTHAGVHASIAINTGIGVIVPQTTIEYVHEFLDDQRSVGFSFVQDLRRRRFVYQTDPPDRDYVNLALGLSMIFPGGVTAFANFRELLAYRDRSSHAVSLGVRFTF